MSQQVQIVDEPLTATGTWMTPPQVANMCLYQDGGLWLGRNGDDAKSSIGRKDDSHVLLCAMNRSGKGRGLITNNLLLWEGSVFCNDPKGENASVCAARRGQGSEHTTKFLDQKTCVLDSHHTAKVDDRYRAYYNVLNDLDPNDEDSASLAEDIAEACITEDVKKDPTWDDMAKPFMKFLLLHIITAPRSDDPAKGYIPDNERDLVTFRKMILTGDFNGLRFCEAQLGKEAVQQNEPDLFELLLSRMKTNSTFGGIISDYARSLEKDMVMQPKLWNSIRSAAASATSWIDDQKMRKVLRAGTYPQTFSAREFKENPKGLSLFVCLRLKDQKKYSAWPRILNNMVMGFAQEDYNASPATGHSTLVMLDEMAALGRMVKMEDDISGIAGAGVKIFMVLQSLSQAQSSYGDNWNNFVANAGTQVYFGINDNFTAEYVSKRLGEVEVIRKMRSGGRSTMEGDTTSDTEGGSHTSQTSRGKTDQRGTSSSHGGSSSYQNSYGTGATVSNGWSPSLFHLSLITSLNRGRSSQRNSAQGGGKTWQKAEQKSHSDTYSESKSDTENWSQTLAHQRSETITEGWSETLHKRPLAAINDLIKLFGTVEDTDALNYPGIGLVVTSSSMLDPFMVIKCYYDRDPLFRGMFDPHPKHGITTPLEEPVYVPELKSFSVLVDCNHVDIAPDVSNIGDFKKNETIRAGASLGHITVHGFVNWIFRFPAPCDCKIVEISTSTKNRNLKSGFTLEAEKAIFSEYFEILNEAVLEIAHLFETEQERKEQHIEKFPRKSSVGIMMEVVGINRNIQRDQDHEQYLEIEKNRKLAVDYYKAHLRDSAHEIAAKHGISSPHFGT